MKTLFLKIFIYVVCIVIVLEVLVRVFHLTKDYPVRFVDERGVERWVPHQEGYSVTGNRRQNFSKFNINSSGYNSYRDFHPSKEKTELALVGDSFIEGFHEHYYNSIGKKIENQLEDVEVYEIGYAGYDFADQLHLIYQYPSFFDLIDHVVIGLKFEDDLLRDKYNVALSRMKLESGMLKKARATKLLVYMQSIGLTEPLWKLAGTMMAIGKCNAMDTSSIKKEEKGKLIDKDLEYIENFKSLIDKYGYDKSRFTLLLDSSITPKLFLDYLNKNNFNYIDFYSELNESKYPTTLIYDQHWNNHGRSIIAQLIADYVIKINKK